MQGEYNLKEIKNAIFQYKDIANKQELEELKRYLNFELGILLK